MESKLSIDELEKFCSLKTVGADPVEVEISIGGDSVLLRASSPEVFFKTCHAFLHLRNERQGRVPDLILEIVETSCPPPLHLNPAEWEKAGIPWKIKSSESEWFVHHCPAGGERGAILNRKSGRGFVFYRDISKVPLWEIATPLKEILNAWFHSRGGQLIHGAVVCDENSAVLLAGESGSGKSSTSLRCLQHKSLQTMGDDVSLIVNNGITPVVHSLYHSAKVVQGDLEKYSGLGLQAETECPSGVGKPTFFLWPKYRDKLARKRPLKAILLPFVSGKSQTRISGASQGDAWRAIAPSTLALISADPKVSLEWFANLIQSTPIFGLELGSDHHEIAEVIAAFLSD